MYAFIAVTAIKPVYKVSYKAGDKYELFVLQLYFNI